MYIDEEIIDLLSSLKRKECFRSKEVVLKKIEKLLSRDAESFDENMESIESIMGKSKVLAHVLLVKEIGSEELGYAFGYLKKAMEKATDEKNEWFFFVTAF